MALVHKMLMLWEWSWWVVLWVMGKIWRDDWADRSVVRRNSRGPLIGTCRPFDDSGFKFFSV